MKKIRIISSGKLVEEYEYDGDGHSNVRITDISNQQMKLVGLKVEDKVEVGYTRDKSKKIALFIKGIG